MPNPKPAYPAQFRQQMIDLVAAGRSPRELSREFGCHETSILSWMRAAQAATNPMATMPQNSAALNAAELYPNVWTGKLKIISQLARSIHETHPPTDIYSGI